MKFINTIIFFILSFFLGAALFLIVEWIDLSQRCDLVEKKLNEVQKELYECRQETETFADIVISGRWQADYKE